MQKPYLEESIKKEFLTAMRAKGKLPSIVTDASERFDKCYYETAPRVFPGPGGMQTVLQNMLQDTEKRINQAQEPNAADALQPKLPLANHTSQQQRRPCSQERKELKERLKRLDQELNQERQSRLIAEEKLTKLRLGAETAARVDAEHALSNLRATLCTRQ